MAPVGERNSRLTGFREERERESVRQNDPNADLCFSRRKQKKKKKKKEKKKKRRRRKIEKKRKDKKPRQR
jgi:hypothetical protein